MNSSYNKNNNGSQKRDPPTRHRPDEDEDKTESSSSSSTRSKTTKTKNISSGAFQNDRSYLSTSTIGAMETTDNNAKQQARAAATRAASSGVYRKPPPPGASASAVTEIATARVTATARAMSDAQAKLRGRKPSGNSKKGNAPTIRYQPQRSMPSHLQSSTSGTSSSAGSSNTTKLQRLQEEVAAKASGKAPNATAVSTQRRPAVLPSSMHSQSSGSVGSSFTAVKRLNRMEADIAAKERARASRRSGTARVKGITTASPSSKSTAMPIAARHLDRMEAEIAAKAKVDRASSALKTNGQRNGNVNVNGNNRVDALAKKLNKTRAARSTSATVPGAVSSNRNAGGTDAAVEETKKKKESTKEGMKDVAFAGASVTTPSDGKKQNGASSKHKSYRNGGSGKHGGGGVSADTTLPSGSDDTFANESHKGDNNNRLAVAVAVFEDENENVFIPSAVEYDPDAKPPVYKNQRFRVYGLLICTLLIIIAACSIGVITILENNQIDTDWIPTESPTCTRCTMDFIEQLELEVGSEKLRDPASPEYMAKEWIIHEDEMQLMPTDRDFIQRFLLAVFYFDTHQIADWRSCNRQNFDPSSNETEQCEFLKLSSIKPLGFQGVEAIRWLSSGQECFWAGIICDDSNQVRRIDLHAQGIQGTLPTIISRIPYIQTIALQWNDLKGTLPAEFGRMKHLIHIELHNNEFTGSLPPSWSNIRNLQLLNLAENRLTGQLPKEVGNFRNIKGLFLFKNHFSGTLPPQLADSNSLAFIRFHKNSFEGTIPSEFGEMQLTELWLHGTNLTGTIPVELGKLTNSLTDIRLSETFLSGTLPEVLFDMSQMWRLDLQKSALTGTISPNITRLGNLQILRLGDNQFTGKVPAGLGSMTKLEELALNGNSLTGSIPSSICNLKEEEQRLKNLKADCLPGTDLTQSNSCECCDECCDASGYCQLEGTKESALP